MKPFIVTTIAWIALVAGISAGYMLTRTEILGPQIGMDTWPASEVSLTEPNFTIFAGTVRSIDPTGSLIMASTHPYGNMVILYRIAFDPTRQSSAGTPVSVGDYVALPIARTDGPLHAEQRIIRLNYSTSP